MKKLLSACELLIATFDGQCPTVEELDERLLAFRKSVKKAKKRHERHEKRFPFRKMIKKLLAEESEKSLPVIHAKKYIEKHFSGKLSEFIHNCIYFVAGQLDDKYLYVFYNSQLNANDNPYSIINRDLVKRAVYIRGYDRQDILYKYTGFNAPYSEKLEFFEQNKFVKAVVLVDYHGISNVMY